MPSQPQKAMKSILPQRRGGAEVEYKMIPEKTLNHEEHEGHDDNPLINLPLMPRALKSRS
jgi:hypothetical protein